MVLNPQDCNFSKYSDWVAKLRSDISPYVYANALNRRDAVTAGFNWRSDPAAGSGSREWRSNSDVIKRSVLELRARKACAGMAFFSYSHFSPDAARDRDYSKTAAAKEIENLLAIL